MPISPRRAGASSPRRFSTAGRTLIENASVRSLEQRTSRHYPRRNAPALHPWQTGVLDIADCDRAEFVIALQEGESAETRIETWPAVVRAFMDQHVNRWVENNKASRTVLAITVPRRTVRVFSAASSTFITLDWEVRPPFSLPPRTTTLLLGHYRFQCQSVPLSKTVPSERSVSRADQCHCSIARPCGTQRLAIPSAGRESGDARGWIRSSKTRPSLSAPESEDLSAQNLL
jgi:hypothetical protein